MPHTWGPRAGRQFANAPETAPAGPAPAGKLRVLFVCIGNSCRSQMAEGFALSYGRDVMAVESAGLAPATLVAPLTRKVMLEAKHIDLTGHWPKALSDVTGPFDIALNISGHPMPPGFSAGELRVWNVEDPVSGDESVQLKVANKIEALVQQLILEVRQRKH